MFVGLYDVVIQPQEYIRIYGLDSCIGIFVYFLNNNMINLVLGLHYASDIVSPMDFIVKRINRESELNDIHASIKVCLWCNTQMYSNEIRGPVQYNRVRERFDTIQHTINMDKPREYMLIHGPLRLPDNTNQINSQQVGELYL